jgi:hypothetical protein
MSGGPGKMKSFKAKFPGKCQECGDPIQIDELICRWGSSWAHAECCNIILEKDWEASQHPKKSHKPNEWRRGKSPGSYG